MQITSYNFSIFKKSNLQQQMKESHSILLDLKQQNKKQQAILRAIQEYQYTNESEDQEDIIGQNKQTTNNLNYENKKILKIQPLNMYKDSITLMKENNQKKQEVKKLEKINSQLRKEYETCLANNAKVQQFLKNRQFTFQTDNKISNGSEILLKAKRNLLDQAKGTKQKLKKMFKDRQVSIIQELKEYISILENQQKEHKQKVQKQKERLIQRFKYEDISQKQISQFQASSHKLKAAFASNIQYNKQRYENYKKQRLTVKKLLKKRQIELKKMKIKQQQQNVGQLIEQSEGLEYEIKLLQDRIKNFQKESTQYDSLREKVQYKNNAIIKLQKELRQKTKTYEYMQQWTKQLKTQLQKRKQQHGLKNKEYEKKINNLSGQYEKYNQKHKASLYEEQIAKKKGNKDIEVYNQSKVNTAIKPINYEEIRCTVKSMSFQLLFHKISTEQFIEKLLRISQPKNLHEKEHKSKFKVKTLLSIEKNAFKDSLTLQQLIHNLQACQFNLRKEEVVKIARFIIEDDFGKVDQQNGINLSIAKQIFKKILERELQNCAKIQEAKIGLQKLLGNYSEGIRYQLKISGGKEQQINLQIVRNIFIKYGAQPYSANLFSELLELYGWSKRKTAGFTKLQDFDQILNKINTSKYHQILQQFK